MSILIPRDRFPGIDGKWARFDGPAGTQVVDVAIEAMAAWQRSGNNANQGGHFAMAAECDRLVDSTRTSLGSLLGADPGSIVIGPSATALLMRLALAAAHDLVEGDEIVCTEIDHDANVAPWLLIARDRGAAVRFAPLDATTGRLETAAVTEQLSARTRWVAVTGASNVIGTMPDLPAISAAAHEVGARVVVDGVHLTPHFPVDVGAMGCDAYVTSAYKWYGPHLSAMYVDRELLDALNVYKVRPAPDEGPGRFELGTGNFEGMAGLAAAAEFLIETGMDSIAGHEAGIFKRLYEGLVAMPHVTVYGPRLTDRRTPTAYFNVTGHAPSDVAEALAAKQIAVWSGHNYGVCAVEALGLAGTGGVRAGVSMYTDAGDVERLLGAVDDLKRGPNRRTPG